mmetsp:Transcript_25676/g.43001  ORF Transcript_25676/g.43001 Transcript_25676/m.43001 type:complete len:280 (-) Transcript_25676:147-986(-)
MESLLILCQAAAAHEPAPVKLPTTKREKRKRDAALKSLPKKKKSRRNRICHTRMVRPTTSQDPRAELFVTPPRNPVTKTICSRVLDSSLPKLERVRSNNRTGDRRSDISPSWDQGRKQVVASQGSPSSFASSSRQSTVSLASPASSDLWLLGKTGIKSARMKETVRGKSLAPTHNSSPGSVTSRQVREILRARVSKYRRQAELSILSKLQKKLGSNDLQSKIEMFSHMQEAALSMNSHESVCPRSQLVAARGKDLKIQAFQSLHRVDKRLSSVAFTANQ